MDDTGENQTRSRVYTEYTPNGGKITRCGKFTMMDLLALEHWSKTDPVCREWDFVDSLCDRRLLPYPELPLSDPYNRPGYPDGDPSAWTPHEAIKKYGLRWGEDEIICQDDE